MDELVQAQKQRRDKAIRDAQSKYWMARYVLMFLNERDVSIHPRTLYRWLDDNGYEWDGELWQRSRETLP